MRRLRVLILAIWAGCGSPQGDPAQTAPPAPSPAQAPASKAPAQPPLKVGEALDLKGPFPQAWPTAGEVTLGSAPDRATILFLWSPSTPLAREELVKFDAWVADQHLRDRADVFAVSATRDGGLKPEDLRDMAVLLHLREVPLLADPDGKLTRRLGAEYSPEIDAISADGTVLAKQLRSLDHDHLSIQGLGTVDARAYLSAVADTKTGPPIPRTFPYYPSDELIGHLLPDAELSVFSADPSTARKVSVRSLLSGKRPAVVLFFSSTCKHCQVDVPQIVKFQQEHADAWDVVGVTQIHNDQHRQITTAYLAQQGVKFPVLEDDGSYDDLLRVTSTPTAFYVTPDGTIGAASYYQHQNLPEEWGKIADKLETVAKGTPYVNTSSGWAFPLTVSDPKGGELDLASLEGTPAIVHFWATWCAPCRAELPDLIARLPELEKRAKVVFVSVEADAAAVTRFPAQTGLSFASYFAPHGGLADDLELSRSVPRTYVLDAHGGLRQVLRGSYAWKDDAMFARVVGQLHP